MQGLERFSPILHVQPDLNFYIWYRNARRTRPIPGRRKHSWHHCCFGHPICCDNHNSAQYKTLYAFMREGQAMLLTLTWPRNMESLHKHLHDFFRQWRSPTTCLLDTRQVIIVNHWMFGKKEDNRRNQEEDVDLKIDCYPCQRGHMGMRHDIWKKGRTLYFWMLSKKRVGSNLGMITRRLPEDKVPSMIPIMP